MHSRRLSACVGAILSLLGGALVIYGVLFLPMAYGNGTPFNNSGEMVTPTSEWTVATVMSQFICVLVPVLLALPLLLMLLVLGMSAASLFHELSPGMVTWIRRAALAGLIIQGVLGFFMVSIYTFGLFFGVGFWIVLLGFVVMMVGTLFNSPRPA